MDGYIRSVWLLLAVVAIAAVGCREKRPTIERYRVTGTVTLNGETLENGDIIFTSAEDVAVGTESSGVIVNGKYHLSSTPGMKKVQIYASESKGFDRDGMPRIVQIVPRKYNEKTKLTVEIPREEHAADFELRIAPRPGSAAKTKK
ncbi:hypothetical protein M4951_14875 [Blastopirellula sp. J2-11]|uniref:hypothetical protein n=1 Tax=Blastopirellula sp. J2-11 TaxID=2943192 RepID=UPI0021CA0119|nr:hypothetical protein [Blastopirellula sp. J2-11]UUO04671.1 hypothetical protein M4951_14875 [Blastopirellula sp. J2-11]